MDAKMLKEFNFLPPFDRPRKKEDLHFDNVSSEEKKYLVEKQIKSGMKVADFIFW